MLLYNGTLRANRRGAQTYLPVDFVRDSAFPFELDEGFLAQIVPHTAVVLLPTRTPIEYPIEVKHPRRTDPRIDLSDFPIEPRDDESLFEFEAGDR